MNGWLSPFRKGGDKESCMMNMVVGGFVLIKLLPIQSPCLAYNCKKAFNCPLFQGGKWICFADAGCF